MDIAIQHPWFRRALGSAYPARLFDQFFGEGMFDYDLFPYTASTISPYYRQSLFRSFLDSSNSGISEVTRIHSGCLENKTAKNCVHLPQQNFLCDVKIMAKQILTCIKFRSRKVYCRTKRKDLTQFLGLTVTFKARFSRLFFFSLVMKDNLYYISLCLF